MIRKKGSRRGREPFFLFAVEQRAKHQPFEHRRFAESACAMIGEIATPRSTAASD
jgi:hypothetical protein